MEPPQSNSHEDEATPPSRSSHRIMEEGEQDMELKSNPLDSTEWTHPTHTRSKDGENQATKATTEETVPPRHEIPNVENPPQASAVLDGTKLILKLVRYQNFQIDQPLKIIFSSNPLRRIERSLNFTTYTSDAPFTTVVIDTGLATHHFIPIVPALYNGVIYTRDTLAHVVVAGSGDLKRMKVSSKALPYKVCNKFIAASNYLTLPSKKLASDPYDKTNLPLPFGPHFGTIGSGTSAGGVIFVRVDDSIFRYQLGKRLTGGQGGDDEEIEMQEGRVVAWSGGVEFKSTVSMWCYKRIHGASGKGCIWIDNPRQSGMPAGGPAALAG